MLSYFLSNLPVITDIALGTAALYRVVALSRALDAHVREERVHHDVEAGRRTRLESRVAELEKRAA